MSRPGADLRHWWQAHRGWRGATIVALAAVIVIVTWYPTPVPRAGFDPSWQIGLHLAAAQHLRFGHDLAFTYGPLGFLLFPQTVTAGTWSLAFIATVLLRVATVALVIAAARRTLANLLAAALFGLIVAALIGPLVTLPGVFAVGLAVVVVQHPVDWSRARWVVPAGLGGLAALCLLMKLDAGASALLTLGIAAWFQGRGRWVALGQFVGGYVVAFVAGWLATGNTLRDVPRWLSWSWSVVSGYSGGAAASDSRLAHPWQLWAVLAGSLALVGAAQVAWRGRPLGARLALTAIVVIGLWVEVKHGFVRQDTHVVGTFFALAVLALVVRWRTSGLIFVGAAIAGLGLVGGFVSLNDGLRVDTASRPVVRPPAIARLVPVGVDDFAREARLLVDGARRTRTIAAERAAVRRTLKIPPALVAAIGANTVHVAPSEIAAVWAYGWTWRPAPQFQAFSTWTARLDNLNARMLGGPNAPRYVLRADVARFDQHSPVWEAPAENLAYLCGYRRRNAGEGWELRERVADRCGPERPLGSATVRADGTVRIPSARANELIIARISTTPSLAGRLRALLYRPGQLPQVGVPDVRPRPFVVPAALLGQPLIVRAPAGLDWPARMVTLTRSTRLRLLHIPGARVRFVARSIAVG